MSRIDQTVDRVSRIAEEAADECGVEVVEVRFRSQGKHSVLRVDIDRPGVGGVGLRDCEAVSRRLDRMIEEAGLLEDTRYDLQVSSPGLDRPIVTDADFRRNTGRALLVEYRAESGETASVRGVLVVVSDEQIRLRDDDGGDLALHRNSVISARQDPRLPGHAPSPRRGRKSHGRRGIV